jgi:hypothetical protein
LEPEFSNHGYNEEIDDLNSSEDENFDPAAENIDQKTERQQKDYSVWQNFREP